MKNDKTSKKGLIVLSALALAVLILVGFWFQHKTVVIGEYTVVYYKNRCSVDPENLSGSLESIKAIPCLIKINWQEPISSDMFQEYSYRPGKDVEKTRLIHKKK